MWVGKAEVENKIWTAVSRTGIDLQEMTLMNQLSFITEYKEYIGFGSLGSNPNLH